MSGHNFLYDREHKRRRYNVNNVLSISQRRFSSWLPLLQTPRLLASNMSFLPLTLLDLANQLFAATGQKEKKGKRPGAAGECWITQLSDWCANTRRWFDSQPRYLLLTVPQWGIQFTTATTCTTSPFLMTLSSLRVIIRGGQIRVVLYCERWS